MPRRITLVLLIAVATTTIIPVDLAAQEKNETKAVVILDTYGYQRVHYTVRTPIYRDENSLAKMQTGIDTALPPADWRRTDFDDTHWHRNCGRPFPPAKCTWRKSNRHNLNPINLCSPGLALMCLRSRFVVTDPPKVKDLTLSVGYRGGVLVYLNGAEIARGHLPKNSKISFEDAGDDYSLDTFFDAKGALLVLYTEAEKSRFRLRNRLLENVKVPRELLRKGTNVLAIEIHRSPYPSEVYEKAKAVKYGLPKAGPPSLCNLVSLRLVAADTDGIVQNAVRPRGVQVWNSDTLAPDASLDWGDPTEPLRPISIVGTRNGAFSGKVVLGSTEPIKTLQCKVSALRNAAGGVIPASAMQVRYGRPGLRQLGFVGHYSASVSSLETLDNVAPKEIPVVPTRSGRGTYVYPGQPDVVFGAVVPIWLTVEVPPDAKTGHYRGTLTIRFEGTKPIEVPVALRVSGWRLPDPCYFRTFADLIHSPESVAMRYEAPLWSDRHFELMEKSITLLGRIGNKTAYVHLICKTNQGNAQTMVRWIPKPGGGYDYDFSVLERFLDLVRKHQKKPYAVCFYVWDRVFLGSNHTHGDRREGEGFERRKELDNKGPEVTMLDPATGKVENVFLPRFGTPESKRQWKPLFDGVRKRMKERGLEETMTLGLPYDGIPPDEAMAFFRDVSSGAPWMRQSHRNVDAFGNNKAMKVRCCAVVYVPMRWPEYPIGKRMYGWKQKDVVMHFDRALHNAYPLLTYNKLGETNIAGEQRGFGRHGADFWPVLKDRRGRLRGGLASRYPQNSWRNLVIKTSFLAPGPRGPLASARFEMMREGIQECEARIFIEEAILEGKLDADLAERCQRALDERLRAMITATRDLVSAGFTTPRHFRFGPSAAESLVGYQWYLTTRRQERTEKLYTLAEEVAKKPGNR